MPDTNNPHWHQLQALDDHQAKLTHTCQSCTPNPGGLPGYQVTGSSLYQYTQATDKPCPGSKIRSKGKGKGQGHGKGKGPIGQPKP
jgi:hypothetical protein